MQQYGPAPRRKINGMAITAMVLGLCGCAVLPMPVAIIVGIVALVQVARLRRQARQYPPYVPAPAGQAAALAGSTTSTVMAVVGLVSVFVWATFWVVVGLNVAQQLSGCPTPAAGYANICTLTPGDCFMRPSFTVGTASIKLLDCTQSHDAQAIAAFKDSSSGAWPGMDTLSADAQARCQSLVARNVDRSKVDSDAQLGFLAPNSASWLAGYHNVFCIVYSDGATWTQSILKPDADLSVPPR